MKYVWVAIGYIAAACVLIAFKAFFLALILLFLSLSGLSAVMVIAYMQKQSMHPLCNRQWVPALVLTLMCGGIAAAVLSTLSIAFPSASDALEWSIVELAQTMYGEFSVHMTIMGLLLIITISGVIVSMTILKNNNNK